MELDDLEYAVNNMNGKNTFERVSAVEEKNAKQFTLVSCVNVEACSRKLAVCCHLGFTRGVAKGEEGEERMLDKY